MNDDSGQWAFSVGLPAKSGISGGIFIVVSNVMGIALYSPLINSALNSVRGIEFAHELVGTFALHEFDPRQQRRKHIPSEVLSYGPRIYLYHTLSNFYYNGKLLLFFAFNEIQIENDFEAAKAVIEHNVQ